LFAIPTRPTDRSQRRGTRLAAILCAAALLGGAIPSLAAARSTALEAPTEMSLSFASATARLIGPEALVLVKCTGSQNGICSGTVTLSNEGHRHKVTFSVVGGSKQSLTVPVGSPRGPGATGLAVAETSLPAGGYVRSAEVLHFR
jgi:hypothetical protein